MPVRPALRRLAAGSTAVLLGAGLATIVAVPAQALAVTDTVSLNAAIVANEPLLEITADFTLTADLELIDYDVEIVGNGHTIDAASYNAFRIVGSATVTGLTVDNAFDDAFNVELVTPSTGSFTDVSTHDTSDAGISVIVNDQSTLQITGGTHEGADTGVDVFAEGSGAVTLSGITVNEAEEGFLLEGQDDSAFVVTGATVTDAGYGIDLQGQNDAIFAVSGATVTAGPVYNSDTGSSPVWYQGYGVYGEFDDASSATIDSTTVTSAPDPVDGAFFYGIETYENYANSVVISNSTVVGGYYGVYIDAYEPESSYSLLNSSVTGAAYSGVYFCDMAGTAVVADTVIDGNGFLDSGYGIELDAIYDGGSLTFRNLTVSNNSAGGIGGDLYDLGVSLAIVDSTIAGNDNVGVNVELGDDATMSVSGSTISGNDEGGLWAYLYDQSSATVTNSTISGNLAGSEGWALWGGGSDEATFDVSHTTVTDNTGVVALGFEDVTGSVTHSIIAGNDISGSLGEFWVDGDGTVDVTVDWSLLGAVTDDSAGAGLTLGAGVTTGVTNPGLEPLALNGGSTQTHLLTLSSPAYNAGNPAIVGAPALDQRGATRIVGAAIDLGAVEIIPTLPATGSEPTPVALTGALLLLLGAVVVAGRLLRRRVVA